ncbi:coiled-coil and C2 domain-containing protein 1B [Microcaecilia unicolor]|uniref:Coiled-coil and C2 domain-containing protein 1B n=1 Tax=Microcaecilia unicolor TaxID=1415580 RepID=A0A6P7Y8Q4_9AMPH|nr:coiled-coil and C2 domain-containing protein 1B [Microcaecilia unicolor]XP_030061327.1 coiled-coil and C2 domain-containing protein 1B [Microcaecilia unicolor]
MPGMRPARKGAQPKGRGADVAKQLGLFVDFNPEEMMMDVDDDEDDEDLEAELAALTGKTAASKQKPKSKAPLPMDDIENMAKDCMKEEDEEDEDLEQDEDLLAELQEVVGEDAEEEGSHSEPASTAMPVIVTENLLTSPVAEERAPIQAAEPSAVSSLMQQMIEDRICNYRTAIGNAKQAGESSKARRYERGLKTLENLLAAVKKGRKVTEEELPPPVATGKLASTMALSLRTTELEGPEVPLEEPARKPEEATSESGEAETPVLTTISQSSDVATPEPGSANADSRSLLVARQKEYKLAALKAKQEGNIEKAKEYMKIGKKFSTVIEALDSGQPVDLSNMPPPPENLETGGVASAPAKLPAPSPVESSQPGTTPDSCEGPGTPQQPGTVLEALQQRMEKYKSAAEQAKASGDDRKARMHERIAKQYQDAIRAQKAGRNVNFAELPVPPGFPPIPGMEHPGGESTIAGILESASKLANTEMKEEDDDGEDESGPAMLHPVAKKPAHLPEKPIQVVKPLLVLPEGEQGEKSPGQRQRGMQPPPSPGRSPSREQLSSAAKEQLEFLENRKKQYMKAALQAKKRNDLEQAKLYLKTAKSFDPQIELTKSGKSVDISKLPSPPTDDESDFIFVHHTDAKASEKTEEVYIQLGKLLKDQYEKCMQYSRQFTHLGNVTETTRFEKMAQDCKKSLEILQLRQAQGLDPPPHHFQERTFKIVRIFSELSSTEMVLIIVRGINLPAPSGISPSDLDAYVKFEFHYPSAEQAQKNKTTVIKNTNSPEYDQQFKLNINRNHRGFKRAIQTKGMKFEVFHKGSFFLFKSDKPVGTAHLKLDKLESESEIREIIEVYDGRKPTGGKLEVKVRLREPLSGQDLQSVTERWLVLEQSMPKVVSS